MADIVHTVEVAAKPDVIYPLVSSGPGFQAWWAEDVATLPGGVADLSFFDRTTIYRLRPLSLENGRRAEWQVETGEEWKGTRLVFELEARKSATLLRFTHAGWARATDYFIACNTTWGALMYRLKFAAEGKAPGPLFLAGGLSS